MLNIVSRKKIFFTLSGALVGAAILAIAFLGFREGIDFSGGTLWQLNGSSGALTISKLEDALKNDLGIPDARVNRDVTTGDFFVRFGSISETNHQKFVEILKNRFSGVREISFQSIGPSVGKELRTNALIGVVLVLVGISLYIAFAFRKVYRPVSSWKYGWITLVTLFHDVLIPAGLLAVLGRYVGVEIDSNFVVALLVVMGFSVHDTIVVFDRIRENLSLNRGQKAFAEVVNSSINQTLARSINTSLTLILVLLALIFTGPPNLHYFVLTLLVGVTTGIYSSIFIASPALLLVQKSKA